MKPDRPAVEAHLDAASPVFSLVEDDLGGGRLGHGRTITTPAEPLRAPPDPALPVTMCGVPSPAELLQEIPLYRRLPPEERQRLADWTVQLEALKAQRAKL